MTTTTRLAKDLLESRATQRRYRDAAKAHRAAGAVCMVAAEFGPAGEHLRLADWLGELALAEKLLEPRP